jgi:hypothetical protein
MIILACVLILAGTCSARDIRGHLDTEDLPVYLRDRGEGIPISMFGTYIQKGQFIIYPFFEYYKDSDYEYAPNELGFDVDRDFRGDYAGYEWLLFIGYGVTDRLAFEFEMAAISAELKTAPEDPTNIPDRIEESGIGDVEGQIRWRWIAENESRPEIFTYFETVMPTQDEGSLIGTTDWEFKLGSGIVRGFSWGTLTGRLAAEYDKAEDVFEFGEYAVEYLKRLSSSWRVFGGVEGSGDEVELITEAQWHISSHSFLKLNNAFGLTSKATDWAPEIGVLFSF